MILLIIILITLFQVGLYIALDKTSFRKLKGLVLMVILAGHFFVFPEMFYDMFYLSSTPDELLCGMPIMGIIFAFWIFGGFITVATHVTYLIVTRNRRLRA